MKACYMGTPLTEHRNNESMLHAATCCYMLHINVSYWASHVSAFLRMPVDTGYVWTSWESSVAFIGLKPCRMVTLHSILCNSAFFKVQYYAYIKWCFPTGNKILYIFKLHYSTLPAKNNSCPFYTYPRQGNYAFSLNILTLSLYQKLNQL